MNQDMNMQIHVHTQTKRSALFYPRAKASDRMLHIHYRHLIASYTYITGICSCVTHTFCMHFHTYTRQPTMTEGNGIKEVSEETCL